jgi:hypothetical protein
MSLTSYRAAPPRVIFDWSSHAFVWHAVVLVPVRSRVFGTTNGRFARGFSCGRRPVGCCVEKNVAFGRPGSDRLSRVLRRSTIGAGAFHGRVRNGNGCSRPAMTTRSAKRNIHRVWRPADDAFFRADISFPLIARGISAGLGRLRLEATTGQSNIAVLVHGC